MIPELPAGRAPALPIGPLRPGFPLSARIMALMSHADDASARADMQHLPRQLGRIHGWIAEGLLGGDAPNAPDLQIGASIRAVDARRRAEADRGAAVRGADALLPALRRRGARQ